MGATIWFIAGDPWGINNIYVGAAIPAIVMVGDWLIRKITGNPSTTTELNSNQRDDKAACPALKGAG
jgi:hypothetical protein